jgi:hypothetical protein
MANNDNNNSLAAVALNVTRSAIAKAIKSGKKIQKIFEIILENTSSV